LQQHHFSQQLLKTCLLACAVGNSMFHPSVHSIRDKSVQDNLNDLDVLQLHEVQHNRTFSMCSLFSQIRDEKGPPISKTLAEMDKKCWGKNHDQENISNFLAK
ncbi:unnamed protein product, partial [Porites lobata]